MSDLRALGVLLALLIAFTVHACATQNTSTPVGTGKPAGVEGKPGIGPEATGRVLGDARPVATPRADRARHSEPPSRLDRLDWAALRKCESSGNYKTDTGNGFYGAYQFTRDTWASVGGTGNPAHASREEQDYRALVLYMRRGAQPWPECGKRL
jgi:hypothetical protein